MNENQREKVSRAHPTDLSRAASGVNSMSFEIENKSVYLSKAELVCLAEVYIILQSSNGPHYTIAATASLPRISSISVHSTGYNLYQA